MQDSNITIWIAFLAGALSFLSPCVLPLVPGYISLMSGISIENLKEGSKTGASRAVLINSLAFNAGLSVIFLALGTTAGWVGAAIINNLWVRLVGGLIIIAFGLQLIGLLKIGALYKDTRMFSSDKPRGVLGSMMLGIAFAAGWTPCIGPILGGIIGLAATSGGWRSGLLLSAFYSAGLAVPFLITGLGINQFLAFYRRFRKHLHKVEIVSGVILILIGLLIMTNKTTFLASGWVAKHIPNAETWLNVKQIAPPTAPQSTQYPLAPDVEMTTLDGKAFHLKDLQGRVVLLNFWATWCVPCRSEVPEFNVMQRELEGKGFTVVGVSTSASDTPETILQFQKDLKQDYTVLRGTDEVGTKFGNGPGLPISYVIDREGHIRQTFYGPRTRETFEAVVKPLLDEVKAKNGD
ncbi:MAG TPA: cytochrome c biogenesis protein/redoxin [Pyrinomonadaceae bacterium]|jgi:cytochrome c-type biogenesis protein|nr:cytochrome c biogenesis protein/redoxin [Pyrinomonadaceae bacterium]